MQMPRRAVGHRATRRHDQTRAAMACKRPLALARSRIPDLDDLIVSIAEASR